MLAQHGVGRAQALVAPHEGRQAAGKPQSLTEAMRCVYVRACHACGIDSLQGVPRRVGIQSDTISSAICNDGHVFRPGGS